MRLKFNYITIGLLVLFSSMQLRAQQYRYNTDSLRLEYVNAKDDTIKLFLLIEIADSYRFKNPKEAINYSIEAIEKAKSMNTPHFVGYAYESMSSICAVQGRYVDALSFDLKAHDVYAKHDQVGAVYNNLNNIGDDYMHLNNYQEAFQYFLKSLKMAENEQDSVYIGITKFNLGKVYKEQENYVQAIKFLNGALEISKAIGDLEGVAYSNFELGNIELEKAQYREARYLFDYALKITNDLNLKDLEAKILVQRGELNDRMKDSFHALEDYFRALSINEKIQNEKGVAETYLGLAKLHLKRNSLENVVSSLKKGLSIAKRLESRQLTASFYETYSDYYLKLNRNDLSLKYYKMYKQLEDSVFNSELSQQLALYETQYESDKKDREIEILNKNKELQKNKIEAERTKNVYLLSSLAVVLSLFVFIFYNYRSKKSANLLLTKQKSEIELQRTQLEKANRVKDKFFSIISHDLKAPFHSLSGVLTLMEQGAMNESEKKIIFAELKNKFDKTSYLLNNLLDWARMQLQDVEVKKESFNVREYVNNELSVINGVQNKGISVYNNIQPNLVGFFDSNMFSTIIRNLVNNGIKFTKEKGEISVDAELKEDKIIIRVKDTGVGISEEVIGQLFDQDSDYTTYGTNNEKGTGLGLKLCYEFVQKNEETIWVESEVGKGTTFNFTIENFS